MATEDTEGCQYPDSAGRPCGASREAHASRTTHGLYHAFTPGQTQAFDLVKELQKDTYIETLCDDGVWRKLSVLAADEIKRLKDALVDCWAFATLIPGFTGSREVSTLVMKVLGDEIGPIYARRDQERRAEREQQ